METWQDIFSKPIDWSTWAPAGLGVLFFALVRVAMERRKSPSSAAPSSGPSWLKAGGAALWRGISHPFLHAAILAPANIVAFGLFITSLGGSKSAVSTAGLLTPATLPPSVWQAAFESPILWAGATMFSMVLSIPAAYRLSWAISEAEIRRKHAMTDRLLKDGIPVPVKW